MVTVKPSAVFIDIDRTLTVSSGVVPRENVEAIAQARKAGHRVFINTGRSYGNIPCEMFEELEVDGWLSGNGADIRLNGKIIKKLHIDDDICRRVCAYCLDSKDIWCVFECDNCCRIVLGGEKTNGDGLTIVETMSDCESMLAASKVEVIAVGKTVTPEFYNLFSEEIDIVQFDTYADCIIKGCNKAVAIEQTLELLSIPRESTIAIGDSGNDLEMLQYCALGVAMGNAEERVKAVAGYLTKTNTECGVAHALKDILKL